MYRERKKYFLKKAYIYKTISMYIYNIYIYYIGNTYR